MYGNLINYASFRHETTNEIESLATYRDRFASPLSAKSEGQTHLGRQSQCPKNEGRWRWGWHIVPPIDASLGYRI